ARPRGETLDHGSELPEGVCGPCRHARFIGSRGRLENGEPLLAGPDEKAVLRALADPPPRIVDASLESAAISGIGDEVEVREHVLHLAPLVEGEAADDLVRDPLPPEGFLEEARLGVRAVEDREIRERTALRELSLHLMHEPLRLVEIGGDGDDLDLLAGLARRPKHLLFPGRVVLDDGVRRIEDEAGRTVIPLEANGPGARKSAL